MVISYMGGQNFKISQGDLTLSYNPPSKNSKLATSKFGADIALVSLNHDDFNGIENASFGEREPFVIQGPGEYEVKEVAVRGFGVPAEYGKKKTINTIYSVSLDGMNLCFMGALQSADLPATAKQELDEIDILFLPIGKETLEQSEGYKLAVRLEPRVIIPMQYEAGELKSFLKEAGAEGTKAVEKLTVKRKDLEGKEGEIVVLSN
jgi:L-ascorbate metabolism protein UlaG (beta-lactamase superfamily)